MPVWKIIAYRKYYINKFMQKERKETLEAQ